MAIVSADGDIADPLFVEKDGNDGQGESAESLQDNLVPDISGEAKKENTEPVTKTSDVQVGSTEPLQENLDSDISGEVNKENTEPVTKYEVQNTTTIDSTSEEDDSKQTVTTMATEIVGPINNVKMDFVGLYVDGVKVVTGNEVYNAPTVGNRTKISYDFNIKPDKDYGVGSTFTFQLPQALLVFDQEALSGTKEKDGIKYSYATDTTGKVTVTFETPLEDSSEHTIVIEFGAKFGEDGSKEGLEQEIEIPIEGGTTIKLPLIFEPKLEGKSMSKEGVPSIENGERFITWTVWTNREGAELSKAVLSDELGGSGHGLELVGNISVEKYVVGLNGVAKTPATTESVDKFPVKLGDGRFAYKLTYKTKVTRVPKEDREPFTNSAILTNNGKESEPVKATVTHTYGTKLTKTVTNNTNNKYNAEWQIEYNYFGSVMSSQTLTDTVTGPHKIKADTINVYSVTVDEAGNGKKGTLVIPQPTATLSDDNKTFTINLLSPNGEAYLIEYETEFDGEYVTEGSKVSNEASYDNRKIKDTEEFTISDGIFSKSRGDIDYVKKEITWTIQVTAEKDMNKFVITDTLTDYGSNQGGTRQTLLLDENSKYVKVNDVSTDATVTDPTKGFVLDLGEVKKGQNFIITYKTKFDILENGTAYSEYKNEAVARWESPSDSTEYSIKKTAEFEPTANTSNNGYKNGSFDHVNQVFNWNVAVNINLQDINGATLVDAIGEGHELVPGTIKVYPLNLGVNNESGTPDMENELTTGRTITENTDKKGFTIKFSGLTDIQKKQAYLITYQTKDSDNIIGQPTGTKNKYDNNATFETKDNVKFVLSTSTTVKHANELIDKKAKTNPDDETITWTVDVNKSHSTLGNITLTDNMSSNQLVLPESFQKREIKMNEKGEISYGEWEKVTPEVINSNNGFTLDLGELNQVGYQVEYKTFFVGAHGDVFSNEASINYTGNTSGTSNESKVENEKFYYNDSNTDIYSKKGSFTLHKVKVNRTTGDSSNFAGITFELWNKNDTNKLYEQTTDSDGMLTFDNIRYGKYVLKEVTPVGYKPIDDIEVTMNDEINTVIEGNEKKIREIENEELVHSFKVKKVDKEGKPLAGAVFKLQKADGSDVTGYESLVSDDDGWITVSENLEPGNYQLIETKAPIGYKLLTDPVTFTIDDQQVEILVLEPIVNEVMKGVTLLKYHADNKDDIDRTKPLQGAQFNVFNKADGKPIEDSEGKAIVYTTNAQGEIIIDNLANGEYYFLEVKAPAGYQLNTSPFKFEIKDGMEGPNIVEVGNKLIPWTPAPLGSLQILKVDAEDATKKLAGAKFDVVNATGKVIDSVVTNSEGVAVSSNLPFGTYTLVETEAPEGYELSTSKVNVTIDKTATVEVTVENTKESDEPTEPGEEEPTDPTDPTKPGDPTKPTDPTSPGKPEDPGKPNDSGVKGDNDEKNPNTSGGSTKPGDSNQSGVKGEGGEKVPGKTGQPTLPQTGEEQFLYMIAIGLLFIAIGGTMLFRRKKNA